MPTLLGQSPGLRHVKVPYDLKINPGSLGWHRRPIVTAPNCRAGTRVNEDPRVQNVRRYSLSGANFAHAQPQE